MAKVSQKHVALTLISLAWLIIFIGRITAPTILKHIITDIDITSSEAGIALSSMWFFYGIMQYPGGALSDSKGRVTVIISALIIFSISCFLIGLAVNFLILLITFSLLGFGAGFLPSPSLTMLSEIFGPKKGRALGIRSMVTSFSGFVPLVLPFLTFLIGWRNIFLLWGCIGLIVAYLFYLTVEESLTSPERESHLERIKIGFRGLMNEDAALAFVINLLVSFTWVGLLSWYPTYILEAKGLGEFWSAGLYTVVLTGSIVLKPIIGYISDNVNKVLIMFILTVNGAIALYLLTLSSSLIHLIIISFVLSQTSAFYPVRTSFLMDAWPSKKAGAKFGLFRSAIILIASPIAAIIGWMKQIYNFEAAILLICGGLILASLLLGARMVVRGCGWKDSCRSD